jgi:hypothetical protein
MIPSIEKMVLASQEMIATLAKMILASHSYWFKHYA